MYQTPTTQDYSHPAAIGPLPGLAILLCHTSDGGPRSQVMKIVEG
jgi:hypothetical protein